jgi:hypothetical protein
MAQHGGWTHSEEAEILDLVGEHLQTLKKKEKKKEKKGGGW